MQPTTVEFLRQLLPDTGFKVAAVFTGSKVKHHFFEDVETLAALLLSEDNRGKTVYHACASYVTKASRKQDNVAAVKALWLDIDAGEGKPYENAEAAYTALTRFTATVHLPTPTVVVSGTGLHAYWFLRNAIPAQEWSRYAAGLKRSVLQHGLHADPARTADAASILRPPGTHNRKGTPLEVISGPLEGPYELEDLSALLEVAPVQGPATRKAKPTGLAAAAMNIYAEQPHYAEPIIAQCHQVAELVRLRGNVPEPLWYAGLGIAARCEGGDTLIHKWSDGHPSYTRDETAAKAERALALSGPTTCAHFASLNPEGCKGCPFAGKITTPLQLGREQLVTPSPVTAPVQAGDLPPLPSPFGWGPNRELMLASEKDGKPVNILISTHPLYLHAIQMAEVRAQYYSIHFKHYKPQSGWDDIDIAAAKLAGPQAVAEMAQRGVTIHNGLAFQKYVREATDEYHRKEKTKMKYEQMGWKDDETAFLAGNQLYRVDSVETVATSDDLLTRATRYGMGLAPSGSALGWKQAADLLFGQGMEAHSFGLLCGFAAPLMRFHRSEEGGAVISLVSQESGKGKSTILDSVATIWGRQRKAIEMASIDTKVAQSLTLAAMGNMPIVFDELRSRDPGEINDLIQVFSQGHDKQRANKDGDLRHVAAGWQSLLITTSNKSLVDLLLENGGGVDAVSYRVLEFDVGEPPIIARHEQLKNVMRDNAGYVGKAYIEYLVRPEVVAWLRDAVPDEAERIRVELELRPQHRFWIRALAAVSIAGKIVKHLGLISFTPERIVEWACREVTRDVDGTNATGYENSKAVAALAEFINTHVNGVLVMPGAFKPGVVEVPLRVPTYSLCVRYELANKRMAISTKAFRKWLSKNNYNTRSTLEDLQKATVLVATRHMTLAAGSTMPGAQEQAFIIDGYHPLVSSMLVEVVSPSLAAKAG